MLQHSLDTPDTPATPARRTATAAIDWACIALLMVAITASGIDVSPGFTMLLPPLTVLLVASAWSHAIGGAVLGVSVVDAETHRPLGAPRGLVRMLVQLACTYLATMVMLAVIVGLVGAIGGLLDAKIDHESMVWGMVVLITLTTPVLLEYVTCRWTHSHVTPWDSVAHSTVVRH